MAMVVMALVASMLGFLAGLLSFRIKSRWCPECGATTITYEARRERAGVAR